MKKYFNWLLSFALLLALGSGCSDEKTNSTEKTEIKTMDSTAKSVKEATEKLEDQTKKVEESLEKLDKEFEENK